MTRPTPKPAPDQASSPVATIGRLHKSTLPLFVHEPALTAAISYSEQDPTREVGGFLIGGFYVDRFPYVELQHFLPALDARSQAASLTFTHESWSCLHREIERRYAGHQVIGWHHSHPNMGIFLSPRDAFIHESFFTHLWQIALVIDPQRRELAFFQWRRERVVACGFVLCPAT
jgi:proteasome lid subunit RPN8/RPN11